MIARRWPVLVAVVVIAGVLVWQLVPNQDANEAQGLASITIEGITSEEGREPVEEQQALADIPPGTPRDPAHVDRLIAEGRIPAEHRDLWLATPYNTPDGEIKLRNLFEVIPENRSQPCEYPENGPQICWNHFGYHPYLMYDVDTLRQLAGADDSVAAAALSIAIPRTSNASFEERFYYATRAAEMTGKGGDILRFTTMATLHPAFRNQGPQMDMYVFARHAESFDTSWRRSLDYEQILMRQNGLSRDELRQRADEIIEDIYAAGQSVAEEGGL